MSAFLFNFPFMASQLLMVDWIKSCIYLDSFLLFYSCPPFLFVLFKFTLLSSKSQKCSKRLWVPPAAIWNLLALLAQAVPGYASTQLPLLELQYGHTGTLSHFPFWTTSLDQCFLTSSFHTYKSQSLHSESRNSHSLSKAFVEGSFRPRHCAECFSFFNIHFLT